MPRPRKQTGGQQLSGGQAAYVLERLVRERRISQGEVNRYLSELTNEISDLERRLQLLRSAHGGSSSAAPARGPRRSNGAAPAKAAAAPGSAKKSRKSRKVSPEQLQSRQLQGRYLALIRQIPANKRAQYKKIASERGREAAIKEMKSAVAK